MSVVVASMASAAEYQAAEYPAKFEGTNTGSHTFKFGSVGTISCAAATLTGTAFFGGPSTTLEVIPAYSNCVFLGISGIVLNTNECKYKFNEPTGTTPSFTGSVDVVCPTEKAISFTAGTCTVTIPSQSARKTVKYTDQTNGMEEWITMSVNMIGMEYTASALCPSEPGTHTNGEYQGTFQVSVQSEAGETLNAFIG
jgi:hypothetical protein